MSIRWSLYVISGVWPLLTLLNALGDPDSDPAGLATLLVVLPLQTIACTALLRGGLASMLGGPPLDRRLTIVAAVLTAVGVLAGWWAFRVPANDPGSAMLVALLMLISLTAALTPVLSTPALVAGMLLGAVAAVGWRALSSAADWSSSVSAGVYYLLAAGLFALTYRLSEWMLVLVWEIDESRTAQARLAVAEERLRFARDFHDTLGRNLTVIAVTSDLAAHLARRGDEHAAEHMLEVRRLAHESAREVRELVSGYRTADLDTELAGARSVLRAAGIRARIIGDGTSFPPDAQSAFGWVLREATTNVIRHSDATECTIELDVLAEPTGEIAVLKVQNDGARAPDPHRPTGNGLAGLGERLAGVGGHVSVAEGPNGHFMLEARLPGTSCAATASQDSSA